MKRDHFSREWLHDQGPGRRGEPYHQQYLAKNPRGYCGLRGTGTTCPVGAFGAAEATD